MLVRKKIVESNQSLLAVYELSLSRTLVFLPELSYHYRRCKPPPPSQIGGVLHADGTDCRRFIPIRQ